MDYTPTKWYTYFTNKERLRLPNGTFNVYTIGDDDFGPILFAIHGCGYSALTWSLFAKRITGKIRCKLIAMDLRGHGGTKTDDDSCLSLNVLADDVVQVIQYFLKDRPGTSVVLVGHNLGGAVATHVAQNVKISVSGLCVIDVVERTALESLKTVKNILKKRPSSFKTISEAIGWSLTKGQSRNVESVRVSVPGQIKKISTNTIASEEIEEEKKEFWKKTSEGYTWRVDLLKTEPYWVGWFEGLSEKFLKVKAPKTLLLTDVNGLDKTLTIGQMQGKFQFQIFPKSGHALHEDHPFQLADFLAKFCIRHKITESI